MPTKGDKGGRPQVLLGRSFLKKAEFKLIFYDEILTFSIGNVIEIFHLTPPPKPTKKEIHQLKVDNAEVQKESLGRKIKGRIRDNPKGRINNEKGSMNAPPQSKGKEKEVPLNLEKKKKKKKEPDEGRIEKKRVLMCLIFDRLLDKLKFLKEALRRNKSLDAHLVKNNSKWK
ncbi:hypothetical protein PIB30_067698 [Stylosanthes scabra]|uniref:Uncharacterized protein n=1 Tax=Stylosanthes scabra TaxID=79078 RepID=A0ABU6YN80_9FABA|nr:hypothetical protein [Stylosanthes scabra]